MNVILAVFSVNISIWRFANMITKPNRMQSLTKIFDDLINNERKEGRCFALRCLIDAVYYEYDFTELQNAMKHSFDLTVIRNDK